MGNDKVVERKSYAPIHTFPHTHIESDTAECKKRKKL